MRYPIAELFHSIQGEGRWTGTPMFFIRLAGCSVGKYLHVGAHNSLTHITPLTSLGLTPEDTARVAECQHSICTAVSGEQFVCDTDYHASVHMTVDELAKQWRDCAHICITGGEPFNHNLSPLVARFLDYKEVMVHIETSGTCPIELRDSAAFDRSRIWITCSPKLGFVQQNYPVINEIKYLVGPEFQAAEFERFLSNVPARLYGYFYLQPINGVEHEHAESLRICLNLLKEYPLFKLSAQLHKYLHLQ